MDATAEAASKLISNSSESPKKDRWAFLKVAKDKMNQKWTQVKNNQKVNWARIQEAKANINRKTVKKKLAQAAIVGMMQIDDTGTYMVQTNMIPKELQPAGLSNFLPDKQVEHPTIKQPDVGAVGKPPDQGEINQVTLNGKPIAEVRNGVLGRVPPKA